MELQHLRALATEVRSLLHEDANVVIGHNQSLDLIATLPGLRNWPEVMAFPERVGACVVDDKSLARLSKRTRAVYGFEPPAGFFSKILRPLRSPSPRERLHVDSEGAIPGVYFTTSKSAIDTLIVRHRVDSDGALIYGAHFVSDQECCISIGEDGIYSKGVERLPSGTLLVLGPLPLCQALWLDSAKYVRRAALLASQANLRVALLVATPDPASIAQDLHLMVRQGDGDLFQEGLMGTVSEDGQLVAFPEQFLIPREPIVAPILAEDAKFLSERVRSYLANAFQQPTGLAVFGTSERETNPASESIASALAVSEHLGPAARIMPFTGWPLKNQWHVPASIADLPYLPSVESAIAQGYRRIVITHRIHSNEQLMTYADQAMIFMGVDGPLLGNALEEAFFDIQSEQVQDMFKRLVAVVTRLEVYDIRHKDISLYDTYVKSESFPAPSQGASGKDFIAHLNAHRSIQSEEVQNYNGYQCSRPNHLRLKWDETEWTA